MLRPLSNDISSCLDIGPGTGSWRAVLDPILGEAIWKCCEVWAPYVTEYALHQRYDEVYIGNVMYLDPKYLHADLVIAGDVLEHMAKAAAWHVMQMIHWKYAILSLPMKGGQYEHQEEESANPFERHLASWTAKQVEQRFPVRERWVNEDIGVFLLDRAIGGWGR